MHRGGRVRWCVQVTPGEWLLRAAKLALQMQSTTAHS